MSEQLEKRISRIRPKHHKNDEQCHKCGKTLPGGERHWVHLVKAGGARWSCNRCYRDMPQPARGPQMTRGFAGAVEEPPAE